LQYVGRLTMCY